MNRVLETFFCVMLMIFWYSIMYSNNKPVHLVLCFVHYPINTSRRLPAGKYQTSGNCLRNCDRISKQVFETWSDHDKRGTVVTLLIRFPRIPAYIWVQFSRTNSKDHISRRCENRRHAVTLKGFSPLVSSLYQGLTKGIMKLLLELQKLFKDTTKIHHKKCF